MTGDDKRRADRPNSIQEDWQVGYVWAFINKFGLLPKIRGLETIDDFEQCLREPVANRPDDVLENICVRFLQNLKPGLRDLDCTNIQHHLSKYISEQLKTSEWTVWDWAWAPNEEAHASCCKPDAGPERLLIGRLDGAGGAANGSSSGSGSGAANGVEPLAREKRNPIKQMEDKGGGMFELDAYERARLLRQLVDWQLTHSEVIREKIKEQQAIATSRRSAEQMEKDAETAIKLEPIGMDRNKKRVWSFDDSARLYQSGNPYKRPCPLVVLTTTRAQLEAKMEEYAAHGAQPIPPPPPGSGPKGRLTKAENKAHKALIAGIEAEQKLAAHIRDKLLPKIEAHEKRVAKAKRKEYERIAALQAAELRTTRTRRTTKVVNYRDLDEGPDISDIDEPRRGSRRGAPAPVEPKRPVIPGERRSARQRGRGADESSAAGDEPGGSSVAGPSGTGSASVSASPAPEPAVSRPNGREKGMKGYVWVAEAVEGDDGGANGHAHEGEAGGADEPIVVDDD